jgi:hypothetical protein
MPLARAERLPKSRIGGLRRSTRLRRPKTPRCTGRASETPGRPSEVTNGSQGARADAPFRAPHDGWRSPCRWGTIPASPAWQAESLRPAERRAWRWVPNWAGFSAASWAPATPRAARTRRPPEAKPQSISKPSDDGVKEHHFIRADLHANKDDADACAVMKGKRIVDEQGDRMFESR